MNLGEEPRERDELNAEASGLSDLCDGTREMALPVAASARKDQAVTVLDASLDVLAELDDVRLDALLLFRFRLEAIDGAVDIAFWDRHAREALQMLTLLHADRTLRSDHLRLEKALLRRINDLQREAPVLFAFAPANSNTTVRQKVVRIIKRSHDVRQPALSIPMSLRRSRSWQGFRGKAAVLRGDSFDCLHSLASFPSRAS